MLSRLLKLSSPELSGRMVGPLGEGPAIRLYTWRYVQYVQCPLLPSLRSSYNGRSFIAAQCFGMSSEKTTSPAQRITAKATSSRNQRLAISRHVSYPGRRSPLESQEPRLQFASNAFHRLECSQNDRGLALHQIGSACVGISKRSASWLSRSK
jgi:hypothetical protein